MVSTTGGHHRYGRKTKHTMPRKKKQGPYQKGGGLKTVAGLNSGLRGKSPQREGWYRKITRKSCK